MLDGERLSYRSLDVEQIGSVYEAIMGFEVEVSTGRSIAIKPVKKHGAPATINLEDLLKQKTGDRAKWLKERSDQDLTGKALELLKSAGSIDDLLAALESKIANEVTPNVVPAGAMIFQPSDERRRSGSHYTPRSLTEPIVRTTLEPILKQLVTPFSPASGEKVADRPDEGVGTAPAEPQVWKPTAADKKRYTGAELDVRIRLSERVIEHAKLAREVGTPHPSQILDLKICDPAMGSGAFLVETCRQLGDELIKAWYAHDSVPTDIPPDEDEVLYARRQVAQRCLYGVDKNIMAVDLAKLSLWLVTLAKAHPFTFLDHSLRHGDSLVGLTRDQIIGFHWEPKKQKQFGEDLIQKRLDRATEARATILNAREDVPYRDQEQRLALADEALNVVRLTGDACVSAFFAGSKAKEREDRCEELFANVSDWYASGFDISKRAPITDTAIELRHREPALPPFHWEIEFPEVFTRMESGFDAFVGNPPFLGGLQLSELFGGPAYQEWLKLAHNRAFKHADLSAYFFRQAFELTHESGTVGLLATKSIAEGSTRTTGLQAILADGGRIYNASRSFRWPGEASVLVAVVHIGSQKIRFDDHVTLDGQKRVSINSRLLPGKEAQDPVKLAANEARAFVGARILGSGFILNDDEYSELALNVGNRQCLMPLLGGEEVNRSPSQNADRFAINFGKMSLDEAGGFPALLTIARERVKPERDQGKDHGPGKHGKKYWWQYTMRSDPLYNAIRDLERCIVAAITSPHVTFSFQPIRQTFVHSLVVFAFDSNSAFSCLQSRVHENWARLFSSSLGSTLRYSVSDAFHTFPIPTELSSRVDLESVGRSYYSARADLMQANNEGLTKTYNRFHDPYEKSSEILHLRELHAAMDRAVLEAYGWYDLAKTARCEFLLDYEDEDDSGDEGQGSGTGKRQKKKPWRLRWPDDFRDEVLARLLELNEQRHKEELLAGKAITTKRSTDDDDHESDPDTDEEAESPKPRKTATKSTAKPKAPRKSKKSPAEGQQEMDF